MSTIPGIGSKGEKNKGKYKGIDINTLYKGKTVETQKSTGNVTRQYGLQSLGKVSNLRRMPPPANLPSLKSENSGNDPSVSLVPSGGSGWVSKEEKKESSGGGARPPSSQPSQATPTSQQSQQQTAVKTNTPSGGQSSAGVRSWSNITVGVQQGGLVSHQSPLFQEEFPSLALEEKSKEPTTQPIKKEEDTKDTQYGPGPSLRPQNVASWREGGGRAVPQPKPDEDVPSTTSSTLTDVQTNGPQMSGGSGGGVGADLPTPPMPPRPGSGHGPHGSVPMGPPMGMPPPQYRGMMPPFMMGRFPHGGYPPNYPGFPRPPYGPETRFRGPPPQMSHQRSLGSEDDGQKRVPIVSEKAFKEFDEILRHEGPDSVGWAGPQGEIDYSEKLVFSDDEDDSRSPRDRRNREERRRAARDQEHYSREYESDRERDKDRKDDLDKEDKGPSMIREAWPHGPPPPHYRGGPRPPHPGMDARGWPPHMHPYEFMGPRGAPPYPPFRMPPPQMRPPGPYGPPPPPVSSAGIMPPKKQEDDDEFWRTRRKDTEGEINSAIEKARHRREENEKRRETEQRERAGEKLRQLDERSKKKTDTKENESEGRDSRTTSESSDKDTKEIRFRDRPSNNTTPPVQSEQGSGGKGYARNVAPRFQKQQESANAQRQQQPLSPNSGSSAHPVGPPMQGYRPGQGPPPPHWAQYDPRWSGMPPHFMDPRYGPRPPLDMQGMPIYGPPMTRRRNDSHGSGNEGQDSEGRHPEQYDRPDPRAAWLERGYPPPHPGHFDEMRRIPPYYDQRVYQDRYDYERREYEHCDQEERNSGHAESEESTKDVDQHSTSSPRDLFEDRSKDKDEHKSERSNRKIPSEWELDRSFSKDSSKDDDAGDQYEEEDEDFSGKSTKDLSLEREEEHYNHGSRRDGRQGPTPKFRTFTSEEVSKREGTERPATSSVNSPPAISLDQSKSSSQTKLNLTSLKRSASNMSSSSAASSEKDRERKSDSPKEPLIFERSTGLKKEPLKEPPKETKPSQSKENKPPEPVPTPNAWEIKEQDRQKEENDKPEVEVLTKEEIVSVDPFEERVESPYGNRPPLKKKRDDEIERETREKHIDDRDRRDQDRGNDRDRPRGSGRGGREFVRGRGGSRGRGRGSVRGSYSTGPRGGRGGGRDYYSASYERGNQGPRRQDKPVMKQGFSSEELDVNIKQEFGKARRHIPEDHSDEGEDAGAHGDNSRNDRLQKEVSGKGYEKKDNRDARPSTANVRLADLKDKEGKDEKKTSIEINKNPWNREVKVAQTVQPPIPQNVWIKNPLLPLPKDEWGVDQSPIKDEPQPLDKINAWRPKHDSQGHNQEKISGDSQFSNHGDHKEHKRRDDNRDNRRRQDRDARRGDRDREKDREESNRIEGYDNKESGISKDKNDRRDRDRDRDRDRYRDRKGDRDRGDRDADHRYDEQSNGFFTPRGEPSRRGRGGSRGGRGGNRYTNTSSGRGQSYGPMNSNGPNGEGSGRNGEGNGRYDNRRGQNMDRVGDGRDNRMESGNYRRDGRRQDNRNQPPPRFRRGGMTEGRGRGTDRGGSGRGRSSRGRGGSAPANLSTKKPVLTKQTSNDGEEWETASESSEPKNDSRESRENKRENSAMKKSISNQRQFGDRQNSRRPNNQDSRSSMESRNSNKESKQNPKNGVAPPKSAANGTSPKNNSTVNNTGNHKENLVFMVDSVVVNDPNAINNAINNLHTKKQIGKKTDLPDAIKPPKPEKEKKDALANIDINNFAGVVVIDDLQEVTIDDPNFLFESNEGFQEVTSKRTMKIKQKLIEAEQKKSEKEAQKKKEHLSKVVARPKGLSPKSGRTSVKGSKLPPRLAKQREQREKEKEMTKNVMPKIELWDNELANNIPSLLSNLDAISSSNAGSADVSMPINNLVHGNVEEASVSNISIATTIVVPSNKTSLSSVMASLGMAPAPAPAISAWAKPIKFGASTSLASSSVQQSGVSSTVQGTSQRNNQQQQAVVIPADVKLDKGDQHDSGIDVSDQPNSANSSTRSSPSADNKLISSNTITSPCPGPESALPLKQCSESVSIDRVIDIPKPQRVPKLNKAEKVEKIESSVKVLKKINSTQNKDLLETKPEPIQMPPSFKDPIFGKGDQSGLQLDFRYDESLATPVNSMPEQPDTPETVEVTSSHKDSISLSAPVNNQQAIMSPTSPATEDLTSKIASVKNFWDPLPPSYEHNASLAQSTCASSTKDNLQSNANSNNATNSNGIVFSNFNHEVVGGGVTVSVNGIEKQQIVEDSSINITASSSCGPVSGSHSPVLQRLHSPHPAEAVMMNEVDLPQPVVLPSPEQKDVILEPTNVCKVRPQQLQVGLMSEPNSMSVLSSGITGPMPTVASPPMVLASQHGFPTFQLGSQFVPQEQRYSQPSFGFSLSQPQPPAGLGGQHQPPTPLAQTFSQPSMFVPSTPTQPELFPGSQLSFQQRNPAFGQPAPAPPPPAQPSTIMVSSSTSALMSTNIKAPGPAHAAPGPSSFTAEPLSKNIGPNQISFSGGLSTGAPSQQLFFYDPTSPLGQLFQPHSQLIGSNQPSQNLSSSQIIGSQLVPTRTPVQPNSSFYQQGPTANFFTAQQPSSAIQVGGPIQQGSSAHQFSMQAFSNQPHGLGLALQSAGPTLEGPPAAVPLHQSLGHGLPQAQAQQHSLGPTASSKGSPFSSMVSAQQQHQHQHMGPSQPALMGHTQHLAHTQATHHLSRTSQIKSPPHSSQQISSFIGTSGSSFSQVQMTGKQFGSSNSINNHANIPHNMTQGSGSFMSNMTGSNKHIQASLSHSMTTTGHKSTGATVSINSTGVSTGPIDPVAISRSTAGLHSSNERNDRMHQAPTQPPQSQHHGTNITQQQSGRPAPQSRFPNPNAPNFTGNSGKFTGNLGNNQNPVAFGTGQSAQQNQTTGPGNNQVRPPMMGNLRPAAPQSSMSQRPSFPNPIQRPGGPPVSGQRPPNIQQFSNTGNNTTMKNTSPSPSGNAGPLNLGPINMGSNALLSNMLINAANAIVNQSMALPGGPNSGNPNHFNMKGPSNPSGTYMGPTSREGPSRPTSSSTKMGPSSGPTYPPNPPQHGSSNYPVKAPGSYPGPVNSVKAQQAQQRQELLNHAKNFIQNTTGNKGNKNTPSSTSAISTTTDNEIIQTSASEKGQNEEGKKPALAMVSNPGLVGTSVKINLSASSNTRAPAITSTVSANASNSQKASSSNVNTSKGNTNTNASAKTGDKPDRK